LIRERAEMLGGNFEVDSNPGKGTRVTFAVPARSSSL
jgi:signal transduction histidine kinase